MKRALYLGIDVGTSAVKTVAVDRHQVVKGVASVPVHTARPHQNWSEQDATDWWDAVVNGVATLLRTSGLRREDVRGIGLTGQMHGLVLLDANNELVRPVLLWNDGRAEEEAMQLADSAPQVAEKTGVLPMPGLTGPKLLWLSRNEPEILEKARWLISPKDYIGYRITGELYTDYSDAAGTWLLDQSGRCWSREATELVGLPMESLPHILESSDSRGRVTATAAEQLGLSKGIVVAAGGGDTPVGAVGLGCVNPGDCVISLGTSAHIFTPTDEYRPAVDSLVHSFCHSLPGRWYQMGAMLNGASALGWFGSLVEKDVEEIDRVIAWAYRGPLKELFLPYLSGERTPHNDARARGVFFGLGPESSQAVLGQAVMEGVAYSIADGRDVLRASGTHVGSAVISGGGGRSRIWAQIISSVLGIPVYRCRGRERGPAFGAARLAILAAEKAEVEDVCTEPVIEEVIEPEKEYAERYREHHERFKRLYRVLQPEFRS